MKFLIDENFPRSVVTILQAAGHEAIQLAEVCKLGSDDEVVFSTAQRLKAVLLTSDRDFYHTMPLLHPQHCGIVVISLHQPNRAAIQSRLQWFLANISGPYDNKAIAIRDNTYCIRQLPPSGPSGLALRRKQA